MHTQGTSTFQVQTDCDKRARLLELGALRRAMRPYRGIDTAIGDYHDGAYESEYVSPYSKSACNVDAVVVIVLQDWASEKFLSRPFDSVLQSHGHDPNLQTNQNLQRLLRDHFGLKLADTFATNCYPFVKPGDMSSHIPQRYLVQAVRDFTVPQVNVIQPRLVVCLGIRTFNAIRVACGFRAVAGMAIAISSPFVHGVSRIWCQAHTGTLGQNNRNRGGVNRVEDDWAKMAAESCVEQR